jgi:hypothetical protein
VSAAELTQGQKIEIGMRIALAHRKAVRIGVVPYPAGDGGAVEHMATIATCAAVGIDFFDDATDPEFVGFLAAVEGEITARGLW